MPGRKGTAVEEGFGGPFSEVDGESDAVAVVAGENHHLSAARMLAEDGAHFIGQENRAAPAVGDADRCKRRVQIKNSVFERAETVGGFASANIEEVQIARGVFYGEVAEGKARRRSHVSGDQAGAEDGCIRFEQASPQIRK